MTNPTPTSGAADLPEALRLANVLDLAKRIDYYNEFQCALNDAAAELRRLHALTAQAISEAPDHVADLGNMVERAISAEPAAHVQNPAENEHIADDMSKNGAEMIMSTQPVAQQGAAYAALPEPLEIDWPELHSQALGCGVEDRGLHNRYECAEYGWQDGVDKCAERVPEQIFDADQMRAFADATHTLRASHGQAPAQPDLGTLNGLAKQYADSYASPHHFTLGVNGLRQIIQRALPQPAQQAPAGASAEPYGWLYDWTHSSATSRADTTYTGFTKDEAHARKHDNCLAIFTAPQPAPSTDSVQEDAARLDWLDQNIFHREMGEWDAKYGGLGNYNMWVMFAPKGAQGSARNILDAARKQGGSHD